MTSTTYPVDVQRWLWQRFTTVLDNETEYDRYNDRLVEAVAADVLRFDDAGLLDLDAGEQQRIEYLLDEVSTDEERVPSLVSTPNDQMSPHKLSGSRDSALESGSERKR